MMQKFFDAWASLKEKHGQRKILVFTKDEATCVLVQDDAVNAAEMLDEEVSVVFGPAGAFWEFPAAYRAIHFRRLEAMGVKIVYVGKGEQTATKGGGLKAEKVRLPEYAQVADGPRKIDARTGRVYVGRAAMGTFWWCPKLRQVFMRRNGDEGEWLGFYCHPHEWAKAGGRFTERLPIPA